MGVSVVTRSECDRCGMHDQMVGAHGATPKKEWSTVRLTVVGEGPGLTDSTLVATTLCPTCTGIIRRELLALSDR